MIIGQIFRGHLNADKSQGLLVEFVARGLGKLGERKLEGHWLRWMDAIVPLSPHTGRLLMCIVEHGTLVAPLALY